MARNSRTAFVARRGRLIELLLRGVSVISLCTLAFTGPAFAQAADEAASDDEIIVTGIRSSLRSSQEIKRNADVFVDSITAEDIGALPDRSVTEALQRVPGVSMNRFAGTNDPDHFSVEGSGVVVRGLNYVRSEFNGRDTFTANNGRELSFADVTPELLTGVDVFKSQSADMIEGGISGVVSLRTRVPFDSAGRLIAGSFDYNYGDFVEEWTPSYSVLFSDRWDTRAGEFGIMLNFVDSQLKSRADGSQISNFDQDDRVRTDPDDNSSPPLTGPDGELVWFPKGAAFRSQTYDRTRTGYAAAAQWESPDDTMLATFQFLRSESSQSWTEHAVEIATDNVRDNGIARPPTGAEFGFDDDGVFTNGVITSTNTGWRGDGNYNWGGGNDCNSGGCDPRSASFGLQSNNIRRDVEQEYVTTDYGFNFKWTPNERWSFNFDYQHVESTVDVVDFGIWSSTYQNVSVDMRGDLPVIQFSPPTLNGTDIAGRPCTTFGPPGQPPFPQPSGDPNTNCTTYFNARDGHASFSDPFNSYWRSAMDHIERSEGKEDAVRFDVDYEFEEGGWLDSMRFGARWSRRDQVTRFSKYNWGVLSEQWGGGGPVWHSDPIDGNFQTPGNGYPDASGFVTADNTELWGFENFMRGEIPVPTAQFGHLPFYAFNGAQNYDELAAFAQMIANEWRPERNLLGLQQNWAPLAMRDGAGTNFAGDLVNPGSPFLPGEINPTVDETNAFYGMLRFGNEFDGGSSISGNVGFRYIQTRASGEGGILFPRTLPQEEASQCLPPVALPPGQGFDLINGGPFFCLLDNNADGSLIADPTILAQYQALQAAARAFANGATIARPFSNEYDHLLPSFNLKWNLNEDILLRFGASKSISRPPLGLTRNFYEVTENIDPGGAGAPTPNQRWLGFKVSTGNPNLEPIESTNFDVSFEWYFADVGSLTFSVFYKTLDNVITDQLRLVELTNNGATFGPDVRLPNVNTPDPNDTISFPVLEVMPVNSTEEGTVKGFEIAYQQFYDFLPSPLDGFGINANYTYIDSEGVPQRSLAETSESGAEASRVARRESTVDRSNLPLQGLSEHNVNFALIYEKGPVSARLAYNWRSEFLLTTRDVIVPFSPIMNEATGQLDGSFFYTINENWKVGVQAVNLTNEVTETSQVLNEDLLTAPRSFFMNDRRYTLTLRATF